jgi:hypothetical protein
VVLSYNSALVYPMLALINISWWFSGTLSHNSDLCTLCWPQSSSICIAMVHWHTVTQLWSCVPSAGSSQKTFISWWYTGTLSHNFYLVNTQLPYHLQFISRWYTGTLLHNSDLVHPLQALIKFNSYCGGTLVHCHTSLICAPSAGSNQVQFILQWYTGTLSHNSDLLHLLLATIRIFIVRWFTGTLSHCHTTLLLCTFCWLQSMSIYIAVVHWYTVTQLWFCVTYAGFNQDIFILRWYTGTLSHNSVIVHLLLATININIYCGGTLVHCHTILLLCTHCWLQSSSIYIAVVHWCTVTQLWSCRHCFPIIFNLYCGGTLVHGHTTLLLCTLCWIQSSSIYITVVHWYTVIQLWSVHPLLAPIKFNLNCGGTLVHCHTALILWILCFHINFNLYCGGTLVHCHTILILCTLCFPHQLQFKLP